MYIIKSNILLKFQHAQVKNILGTQAIHNIYDTLGKLASETS